MSVDLHAITFDCADPATLAGFWAKVLGRTAEPSSDPGIVTIGMGDGSPFYVFQRMDHTSTGPNRVHADFSVAASGFADESARLLGLGATAVAEVEENGIRFTTFADPEGNKFDLAEL